MPSKILALLLLASATFQPADAADPVPASDRCVILISVDGLANFYLDDPNAHLPTLRKMAKDGARADGVVCSFPTVTWPNHTTMVTGVPPAKHGVMSNTIYDRIKQEKVSLILDPLFDKDEVVKAPTIYDLAHQAGLVTASIAWPCTRAAKTLDYTVPDMGRDAAWAKYGTTSWLAELKAEGLPIEMAAGLVRERHRLDPVGQPRLFRGPAQPQIAHEAARHLGNPVEGGQDQIAHGATPRKTGSLSSRPLQPAR